MYWFWLLLLVVIVVVIVAVVWWGYCEGFGTDDLAVKLARKGCPQEHLQSMVAINQRSFIPEIVDKPWWDHTYYDPNPPSRSITIATLSVGNRPFKQYTLKSLQAYAQKHGYNYIERNEHYEIPDKIYTKGIKDPNWQKLFWVRDLLDTTGSEYVVWFDDDILVTNDDRRVEDIISLDPDKDFFISHDMHYTDIIFPFKPFLNSGAFIVRNSMGGRAILDAAIATYYTHEGWFWTPYNDQTAVEYVYFTTNSAGFLTIPHGLFQTIHNSGEWLPGQFLCHFAGQSSDERLKNCLKLINAGHVPSLNTDDEPKD